MVTEVDDFSSLVSGMRRRPGTVFVVYFFSRSCVPCMGIMTPFIETLASRYGSRVVFIKCNVATCQHYDNYIPITAVPTVVIFENAQPIKTFVGTSNAALRDLENTIQYYAAGN